MSFHQDFHQPITINKAFLLNFLTMLMRDLQKSQNFPNRSKWLMRTNSTLKRVRLL